MEVTSLIPKRIHFVYGLSDDFASIPFSYFHYLSVLSAKTINVGYEIVIHYFYEPVNNEWWERCKALVTMDKLNSVPTIISNRRVKHTAHKADLVRVEVLLAEGGIYLDMDTLCIKPFDPFLTKPFVMGMEIWKGMVTGLCNAVIMSEPQNPFLKMWHEGFADFDPNDWNKIACRKPLELFQRYSKLVYIEPPESFFRLTWSIEDLDVAHKEVLPYHRSYSMHLWESISYKDYLSKITEADVLSRDSTYNILARRVLQVSSVGV